MKFKLGNKQKYIHIAVIVLGIIFVSLSAFHSSLWFDESYSVAIAKHNFIDIWKITGHDVHPALYYWGLHIIFLIFGNAIILYRLFSIVPIALMGIGGYTHIRKEFDEKTGILFSFFSFFLPIICTYAVEIRMYSWSCFIVTVMTFYGYKFYMELKENKQFSLKYLSIFGIFSICSCYIHYYALVTACLENLLLLIFVIKNYIKNKSNEKEKNSAKKSLIAFIILASIQIILYIPWLIYMLGQLRHVENDYWIANITLLNTIIDITSFQFKNRIVLAFSLNFRTILSFVIAVLLYIYISIKIFKSIKEKRNIKPAMLAISVYVGVIVIIAIVSIKMPILYSRYLLVMTGAYIFAISYLISTEKNKYIIYAICVITLILAISSNVQNIQENYASSNSGPAKYLKSEIQKEDIIVYSNIGNGGVIAAQFPENKQYFLNLYNWEVEEAYKA